VKKTFSIYIAITFFVIIFSIFFVELQDKISMPETTLVKSFSSTGARIVSSEVYFWGGLNDKTLNSFEELKEFTEDFSLELGIAGDNILSRKTVDNDVVKQVEINGTKGKNKVLNISTHMDKTEADNDKKYISVSFVQDLSIDGLEEARNEILKVFKKYNITPKINSCITGSFEGKLEYTEMNNVCKKIFNEAGAKKVEGMRDGNFISISAYSPAINDYIRVEENKVNLNVAIRYNSYENKTYIWLATPVITTEY